MIRTLQVPFPAPLTKPKNKLAASQVIPVVIIIVSFVGALYFTGFFEDAFSNDIFSNHDSFSDSDKLTPTRDIEGTWTTAFATEFTIATDFQFGQLSDVGTEHRTMKWSITSTDNEHAVIVDVEFTSSNRQVIAGSGFIPDLSPMQLTGTINGTQLTLTKKSFSPIEQIDSVGVFTFTSTHMQGTWHDHWTGVYEQNVYTSTNGLKLTKQ
jgi:hypothetical protein